MGTALLLPWHIAFGDMDAHTRLLVYGLGCGPFFLLVLVTFVHRRRTAREEAAEPVDPFEAPPPGAWLPAAHPEGEPAP